MRTNILIISTSLGFLSLMALPFSNWNNPNPTPEINKSSFQSIENIFTVIEDFNVPEVDFVYDFGPRYRPITKTELNEARSFGDFVSEDDLNLVDSYDNITIIVLENSDKTNIRETSYSGELSKKQLKLLSSADYSSHFRVDAMYFRKNKEYGKNEYDYMVPHRTVVPETQAKYSLGKDSFLEYLIVNNKENTFNLDKETLKPGQLNFTVTKDGEVDNITLTNSSGYNTIDQNILNLVNDAPGLWIPAKNGEGKNIAQTFMVSFGIVGC